MSNKKTLEEFKREVFNVFGGNAEVIGEYINNKTKILVKFNCCGNEEYKIPTKLLIGQGCSKCTGKRISKSKTNPKVLKKLNCNFFTFFNGMFDNEERFKLLEVLSSKIK